MTVNNNGKNEEGKNSKMKKNKENKTDKELENNDSNDNNNNNNSNASETELINANNENTKKSVDTEKSGEKKKDTGYDKTTEEIVKENKNSFISQISKPLLKKKYYKYFLKILDYIYYTKLKVIQIIKTNQNLEETKKKLLKKKLIIIGLTQVVKAIRKGVKGIVILAIDVFPLDIICHIPIFCEEHNIPYTFITTKNKLARLCKLKRATTCIFICKPDEKFTEYESTINQYISKKKITNYLGLFEKFDYAIKKNHPFFQ
ncbi:60S ribosomal protein L7ae/L30e, putative [Hepatocystis sp. ex Piliocolobus tephrosceles]|nr:60S ribosomal protein L7ae/L30e, putative [Hepatocystis sp. ex Piliocolobus tephrosceles]